MMWLAAVLNVPAAAQPSAHFDAGAATNAWLATVPAAARAASDAYFEGGYWLILWDFLWAAGVMALLLETGWSARWRDWCARAGALRDVLYGAGFVVAAALDGDAIFGSRQFVLQAHEVLIGFQLRIVFNDDQQSAERRVQLAVGSDFVGGSLRVQQGGTGFGDFAVDGFFVGSEAFYGGDEVGD